MKILIVYFSRAGENYSGGSIKYLEKGNNEVLAEKLKALLPEADVFKIEPLKPYSDSYLICIDEAKEDLRKNARPALKENLKSVDEYDKIFLIYPIYWGTFPVHVFTFLESFDFSGKTIVPIVSHEGSGFGSSEVDLRKLLPNSEIQEGTAIYGSRVNSADSILEKLAKI
ncbi:MAG: NAD(P)H-dependent oxidoreductase [Clostridia bacterium]|nr:NAD(P)H-dependent oxidoreductase [Clostridia bacterium]